MTIKDPTARERRPARGASRGTPAWVPFAYLAPAFLLYGTFLLFPLGRAVQFSFFEWDGLGASTFVGFDNYVQIVQDERLREAFGHAFVLIFFYAVLPLAVGLMLAAILTRARVRGLGFFRTLIFLPQVIAMVVVAVTWRQIYAPDGPLNGLLRLVGLESWTRAWLGDYTFTLPAVGLIGSWVSLGLVTVLLMAGMSRVPKELYEAARLDGAGPVREFFSITLPSVRGEITVALTLTIVAALKTFDLIYVTTSGGPGTSTTVPSFEVYRRAFELGEVGAATAVGAVLTLIVFAINFVVNRIGDRA
ncbi:MULTISPECIES: carbohydrate ABC transporter permease [unclassified Pseudoclavibacter]|uniref:carbohydrate ABC transporter permease n=1 Tax=unclassified Pseudoclavibacter TaxID=2615177 RepID=UPI000CE88E0D|nr:MULTISPECIES: sugar ABC transporter permease [unclassified Pseudoclavibacter]NYF14345.1 raffinose/stachyose/melibiose transport system permease protein [Pseudoclavibacter sp. JAI123]PPG31299.1 sugar ABC transporter permease [Pseudoclavibacter sp. RFBB5]